MDNPEKLETLGTQDTGRRQTNKKKKKKKASHKIKKMSNNKMLDFTLRT